MAIASFSAEAYALSIDGYSVYPNHPRIWFLQDDTGMQNASQLLSVADVRKLVLGPNSEYFHNLGGKSGGNTKNARSARVQAFRYVIYRSESDAKEAYQNLISIEPNFNEYEAVDVVVPAACAYDWIYNWLAKPGNEILLTTATKKLRTIGRIAMSLGNHGPFSNITSAAYRGGGLLHVGIALGDQEMIDMAYAYYRDELLKTANMVGIDGGWGEGLAYMNELYAKNMILGAELLFTATEGQLNLFTSANPFFVNYIPFTLFAIRPDFTYPHWSDIENFSPQYSRDLRENLLPLTFRFSSRLGQHLLSKLDNNYGYQSMYEVLWKRSAPASAKPDTIYTSNPDRSHLFHGIGLAIMRTGFAPDDTYVSFKASNWLSSHVHADAGHFEIFKNGPLAIDSGSYDEWGSRHMRNYYARTIAHNALTIYDPDEPLSHFSGYVNDGGQLYWDHNVFPTYQDGARGILPGSPFHAATIQNYSEHADFTYVGADLTGAYSSGKATNVDRQLFYFPNDKNALIVIIDRVTVTNRRFPVSFLLHYDGILAVSRNAFMVSNGVSKLYGKVLLPAIATLTQRGPYEVSATSYPPSVEYPESGKGRLEVTYSSQESNDLFFITILSVDQQTPSAAVRENAKSISIEFTYAEKQMEISTSRLPRQSAGSVSINGRKISLENSVLTETVRP
jgi:hypothetical protein